MASNEKSTMNESIKRMNSMDKQIVESKQYEDSKSLSTVNNKLSDCDLTNKLVVSETNNYSNFPFKAVVCVLWYLFSFSTLFLNKYIITYESGDTALLGTFQMLFCVICSYIHLKYLSKLKLYQTQISKKANKNFEIKLSNLTCSLFTVGSLRYSTILLGLVALWYVPISFAETIKSSAPVFTVLIARYVLNEQTSFIVNLSLIPVMSGLALCSAYELSFTFIGFMASLATNLSECLQNIFSKKLLSVENYEPSQLQFYTSLSSFIIQIPCILLLVDFSQFITYEKNLLITYILASLSFYLQSMAEYTLLNLISPVTHSVANTVKRALLIWLSVIFFGNAVTTLSWIGTGIVIFGVFLYNKARQLSIYDDIPDTYKLIKNKACETHDV